jgi:hypothetical protein
VQWEHKAKKNEGAECVGAILIVDAAEARWMSSIWI